MVCLHVVCLQRVFTCRVYKLLLHGVLTWCVYIVFYIVWIHCSLDGVFTWCVCIVLLHGGVPLWCYMVVMHGGVYKCGVYKLNQTS